MALHRVAALVRLHRQAEALDYAAQLDSADLADLPPERRVNYLLDLTTAYAHTGRYPDAVRALNEAERVAPEEVRCRPVAHGLLRQLLSRTQGEAGRLVRQLAVRAGVPA